MSQIAFVAIGRNEGERLKRCLRSLRKASDSVIYVDSGSTDGSIEFARSLGVEVLELDVSRGFTMARARNAGWKRLLEITPSPELVHFIDGDCELIWEWVPRAITFLDQNPGVAAVCGRRREMHPEASFYNLLCEIEWNTPIGEAHASGGDVLMRIPPLESVGGFNEDLIAFEEPDLCRRIRNKGWKIWRLDEDMTRHDANILTFAQWWKRHERAGYGAMVITDNCREEGDTTSGELFAKQVRSPRIWLFSMFLALLLGIPLASLVEGWTGAVAILFLLAIVFVAQALRIAWFSRGRAPNLPTAILYGVFTMIAKLPQSLGQLHYARDRAKGRKAVLIEYK